MEHTAGKADTPGFRSRQNAELVSDHKGHKKIELPRASKQDQLRLIQTSLRLCQGWRANCDFQFMYYESDPMRPEPDDIARVTDYIVSYACKGIETIREEKAHNKALILTAKENTLCSKDVKRVARQILNRTLGEKLISKQECMVQLAGLDLFHCSERFENVSLSRYEECFSFKI